MLSPLAGHHELLPGGSGLMILHCGWKISVNGCKKCLKCFRMHGLQLCVKSNFIFIVLKCCIICGCFMNMLSTTVNSLAQPHLPTKLMCGCRWEGEN